MIYVYIHSVNIHHVTCSTALHCLCMHLCHTLFTPIQHFPLHQYCHPKILKKHPNNFCAATFTSTTSASSDTKISSQRPLLQSTWSFILWSKRWRLEESINVSCVRNAAGSVLLVVLSPMILLLFAQIPCAHHTLLMHLKVWGSE